LKLKKQELLAPVFLILGKSTAAAFVLGFAVLSIDTALTTFRSHIRTYFFTCLHTAVTFKITAILTNHILPPINRIIFFMICIL
jgi:hypothetical protein